MIRLASEKTDDSNGLTVANDEFEGAVFSVTRGDYSPLMKICADFLEKAREHAGNNTEKSMLAKYVESFRTGSLDAHKAGSRHWIKNLGPVIETYIGFIETYRDPAGERGEFCGWVAMVNKERSANFSKLVASAEVFVPRLPWSREFEKDVFLRPDFTSLDVLCFSCSGVPAGINIPNYDVIRQNEGFKNVALGNVMSSTFKDEKFAFVSKGDEELLHKYRTQSFEVQVGLHELLGHGSGKLLKKLPDGRLNFTPSRVINPLTNQPVDKWYEATETYDSKFTTISSSYEECRAEAVGLYLSLDPEVLAIFGYEGEEAEMITYINWFSMMWRVVTNAPDSYSPEKKCWLQAHTQARFVLLRVLQEAGEGLIKIEETVPGKDLLLTLDRTKLNTVGKKAIGDFLVKLQVFKATGDVQSATEMYNNYSKVPEDGYFWKNWRKIALDNIKPRKMFVQSNTIVNGDQVELKRYEASLNGVIQSWVERFPSTPDIHAILEDLWQKDKPYFQY